VCVYLCVRVCVCERERECVYLCLCEREREREVSGVWVSRGVASVRCPRVVKLKVVGERVMV